MAESMVELVDEINGREKDNPRILDPANTPEKLKMYEIAVGIPCPTGVMTRETAVALKRLVDPMFSSSNFYSPDGMEVGEARNEIVRNALKDGADYIFFIDYDVIPPPNALTRLRSLNVDIAAGVYHLKQVPSAPLIFVEGWPGGFEDYELGDLVKADGVGMGCTLIKADVFRNMEEPWFKTVPGHSDDMKWTTPSMTEDIYFCRKAKDAGFEVIVDTGVQCGHVDSAAHIIFHYVADPNGGPKGMPGWSYKKGDGYVTETVAAANHPDAKWNKVAPQGMKRSATKIDLGCGHVPAEGFTGVDLYVDGEGVLKYDISDLSEFRQDHGLVEAIRSSHSLEHMSHIEIPRIFRDWVQTLDVGGHMEVRVPDGEFHMRAAVKMIDEGNDDDPQCDWLNATIYGLQIGEGQEHKSFFTMRRLEQLALSHGLVDVSVERVVHEGDGAMLPETAELVLTGKRGE